MEEGTLTTGVATMKTPRSIPIHPPFNDMVFETIKALRERRGSSRQKIVKYIGENYRVVTGYEKQVNLALKRGVNRGVLLQVRGMGASGSFKINKDGANGRATVVKFLGVSNRCGLWAEVKKPVKFYGAAGKENRSGGEMKRRQPRTAGNRARERIQMLANGAVSAETVEPPPSLKRKWQSQSKHQEEEEESCMPSEDDEPTRDGLQCETEEDNLCEYERQRLRNIQENLQFITSLNLMEVKQSFRGEKKMVKPKIKKEPVVLEPSRRSLRLRGCTPEGTPRPPPPATDPATPDSDSFPRPRKPSGPLPMEHSNKDCHSLEREFRASFMKSLHNGTQMDTWAGLESQTDKGVGLETQTDQAASRAAIYSKLKLKRVAKVTPKRGTALQFHPSTSRTLVAMGDKHGNFSLWGVDPPSPTGVFQYSPHSRAITGMVFPHSASSPLIYTCSYDGTLRCADLERGVFDEIYSLPEESELALYSCDLSRNSDWLIVGQGDGSTIQLDPRGGREPVRVWECHRRAVKCVHVNPLDSNYLATASGDGSVAIWDCRKVAGYNSCVQRIFSNRTVTSAYFSPLSGRKLLTTSLDNYICVFQSPHTLGEPVFPVLRIHHNNQTGRWLTSFRAEWDPSSDEYFIVGSLTHPRQVELHCTSPHVPSLVLRDEQLTTVCSLTTIHPHTPIIAGATSSGRVLLWN